MPLLVDSGALYALADADDAWHEPMRSFLREERRALIVPVSAIPETTYLIRTRLGSRAERRFVESLAAQEIAVESLTRSDLQRSADLLTTYEFLGFVDASIVAVLERLKLKALVTTDRRDFARVRPRHIGAFELLP